MLIKLMKDDSVIVRDSVAWTLGRICEILPQVALENYLQPLIETLLDGLDAEPRVAANVCWVRYSVVLNHSQWMSMATSAIKGWWRPCENARYSREVPW